MIPVVLVILGALFSQSDPDLSHLFFGAGIVYLIGSYIYGSMGGTPLQKLPVEPSCPPHSWSPDEEDNLRCTICKKRPGEIITDYDKPY